MHAEWAVHDRERRIAARAAVQENLLTRQQLFAAGLSRSAIAYRVHVGTLQRLHRGIYLLGAAPPTQTARCRAAAMACGAGAFVSHRSAAALWGMLPPQDGLVHVTVAGRKPRGRAGLVVHQVKQMDRRDIRRLRGIPLTSPVRTICDLAATEPLKVLERALNEAQVMGLLTERELAQALQRSRRRKGIARLRGLLGQNAGVTRNDAERLLLRLAAKAGLPRPLANAPLLGFNVDLLWPHERLIIEFDGFAAHGHRQAFERDRRRDRALMAAGYRVMRITWRQLTAEPYAVIADIAQALIRAA